MSELKAGFARVDITPMLGDTLEGYYYERRMEGFLDPLYATAVAFDNGEQRVIIMSLDIIGLTQEFNEQICPMIAKAADVETEGIFLACTHTHLGPTVNRKDENQKYIAFLKQRLCDVAVMAVRDLAFAEIYGTRSKAEGVSFIRRYEMGDGSIVTNPGYLNPNIVRMHGTPDEETQLLVIKREGKPEIGIVNFQTHPDTTGGNLVSADYPHFIRKTYETLIANSLCMYINGAQGDSNHIDTTLPADQGRGYHRAEYMGKKVAMSVIENYPLAKKIDGQKISFARKTITVKYNKGTSEELAEAKKIYKEYIDHPEEYVGKKISTTKVPWASRIVELENKADEKKLMLSAVSVGDVVFAGFPGEPFTEVGREIKSRSKFEFTIPSCCTNGYEGYYPMAQVYEEGGYECNSARYVKGTAEKLIEESCALINSL